jgi:hypothetical protein
MLVTRWSYLFSKVYPEDMASSTDIYRKRARLLPVRVLILPAVLAAGVLIVVTGGGYSTWSRLGTGAAVTLMTSWGLPYLLEQFGRDQGKKKEPELWKLWGGAPTTQMLRHRDTTMCNPVMRARYHATLSRVVSNIRVPSPAEEMRDPAGSDHVYETCVRYLINYTRDASKFPLVFEENVNYGFRRNLWAMRSAGLTLAGVGMLVAFFATAIAFDGEPVPVWSLGAAITLVNTSLLVWWILRITPSWVFIPAKAYAERLLEACDSIKD